MRDLLSDDSACAVALCPLSESCQTCALSKARRGLYTRTILGDKSVSMNSTISHMVMCILSIGGCQSYLDAKANTPVDTSGGAKAGAKCAIQSLAGVAGASSCFSGRCCARCEGYLRRQWEARTSISMRVASVRRQPVTRTIERAALIYAPEQLLRVWARGGNNPGAGDSLLATSL